MCDFILTGRSFKRSERRHFYLWLMTLTAKSHRRPASVPIIIVAVYVLLASATSGAEWVHPAENACSERHISIHPAAWHRLAILQHNTIRHNPFPCWPYVNAGPTSMVDARASPMSPLPPPSPSSADTEETLTGVRREGSTLMSLRIAGSDAVFRMTACPIQCKG